MYLSNVTPWKSSSWVAPAPDEIDRIRKEAGTHDGAMAEEGDQILAQNNGDAAKDSLESGETGAEKQAEHRE